MNYKYLQLKFISVILILVLLLTFGTNSPVSAIPTPSDPGMQGMHTITSRSTGEGITASGQVAGTNVYADSPSVTENFNWQLIFYGKYINDYYLINQYSMLIMGIEGASTSDGANVVTEHFAKDTATDWSVFDEFLFELEAVNNYFAFRSSLSGLYLTLDGTGNIVQSTYTGSDNQLWDLTAVDVTDNVYDNLVWAEEFDYTGLPDPSIWSYEQTFVNNELQGYTIEDTDNVWVENGYLTITAIKERFKAQQYTSARIVTRDNAYWTYGMIEARIKVAGGTGTWPAFWMMPQNYDDSTNPWPQCGEIDIMEYVGYDTTHVYGSVHNAMYNGMDGDNHGAGVFPDSDPVENWHTYAIKWSEDRIVWMLDGWEYFIYENVGLGTDYYPYISDFYVILNLAIGGDWGGVMGVDDSIFPVSYYIDYVRVYQESSTSDSTPPSQVTDLMATPVSSSQIDLTWTVATDDTGVDGYNIYRDSVFIGTTTTNSYGDTGLSPETSYDYQVAAFDVAGNVAPLSNIASATTDVVSTGGIIYVNDITITQAGTAGPFTNLEVTVTIVDTGGAPVVGAQVTISTDAGTFTSTTDSTGVATFLIEKAIRSSGTFTVTVTNVFLSGYTYDSGLNAETTDSITV